MFSLCIILLSISSTLACNQTNFRSSNDDPCMVTPTLIDMNPVEHKYPFVITLDKRSGSCNALSPKICVTKKTKGIYIKAFHMITNKNEAKQIAKYISRDCKCNFDNRTCYSNQKWNNKTCQCECKNYHKYENGYNWNPNTCICENSI